MDNIKHKFELLKMARELLNEEYINRRAEDHNKWVAECDVAWKNRGIKLPYPPFAPYPTEAEIIAKASSLYGFLSSEPATELPAVPVTQTATDFAVAISQGPPWNVPLVNEPVAEEPVTDSPKPMPDTTVSSTDSVKPNEELRAEPVPEPKPLFAVPSWLQKIQK